MDQKLNRKIAEAIVAEAAEIDRHLGWMAELLKDEPNIEVRDLLIDGVFKVVWQVYEKVTLPIHRIYPDLDPEYPNMRPLSSP